MTKLTLENLKRIAKALSAEFGSSCEIVIHDLSGNDIEHSIVHIENGDVSGRKVGDGPSQIALDAFKKSGSDLPDHLAYLLRAKNGHILKSSTVFIRDDDGKICYIFAINYDITNVVPVTQTLNAFLDCEGEDEDDSTKIVTGNVNDLLDELIRKSVELVGIPVNAMSKEDKIKAIEFLNDSGAFLIKKSGDKVANYFGISKYTLYGYVDINK